MLESTLHEALHVHVTSDIVQTIQNSDWFE